ncbi:hypothetical protein Vadar_006135 [Vaccinium darrowii]|uniref:Uncharacterized protein n=1 Tax=Vaccinium darrowii TaxID=229202 RepID=A0ACB7XNJ5_9ERIC|nr:hypothetical protein Vadar_006135 [Vaccinium darrowii]
MPKIEVSDMELPSENMHSMHNAENVASSSGSNLRSSFIAMGFAHSLVNKVIEEKGEDDADLILETLFAYSARQNPQSESSDSLDGLFGDNKDDITAESHPEEVLRKPCSESSDSLDGLFGDDKDTSCSPDITGVICPKEEPEILDFGDDKDTSCSPNIAGVICPKEEPEILDGVNDDRRASLLMMNFSVDEINFAMNKLGGDAPISELVDFIFAAQIAENLDKDGTFHGNEGTMEGASTESLFGTMDKTLRLLEMGFSENQISAAIEKYGSEVPITELADSICADEIAGPCNSSYKHLFNSFSRNYSTSRTNYRSWARGVRDDLGSCSFDPMKVKTEDFSAGGVSHNMDIDLGRYKGKRPKEEYIDELSGLKRPKQEYDEDLSSSLGPILLEARKVGSNSFLASNSSSSRAPVPPRERGRKTEHMDEFETSTKLSRAMSSKSVDQMVSKRPYFFYGNVMNLSRDSWMKISQFLYGMEPEFANSQFFSALTRKEGYVHNLPSENRFHILPKPPMTIQEAIPHTKKWWPSWDVRKQLGCISSEISGISPLCDRLGKILTNSRGLPSVEQQRDILHHCRTSNLIWFGHNKLGPMEPEHLERILGYPLHHTRPFESSLRERLQSLKNCFQTDTLGYHLSVLKSLFPGGITVFSVYSGIGGAEISLHRLGIHLKGVVSVEPCETKRKVLKKWWQISGQTGDLVQIESIQKLASNKLEDLIAKFGGFDFIICQNSYTHSSKVPTTATNSDSLGDFDFSLFYEFVRILQRIRNTMERSR